MQTNRNSTRRSLLVSATALILSIAMLVGTTFAWFTDSASTDVNKIKAGNLDVQLLMYDGTENDYIDISNDDRAIFGEGSIAQNNNAETRWEPGKTQVAYLAIKNNGNLALKYKVALDVTNVSNNLYEVMEYAITPDATNTNPVTAWTSGNSVVEGTQVVATDVSLPVGATHKFALSVHMKEEAGNTYQNGEVNFDLTVYATQDTVENDSYGNDYDKDATYPVYPLGFTEDSFAADKVAVDDKGTFYSSFEEAMDGVEDNGAIYLKENGTVDFATHLNVTKNITIYGNGTDFSGKDISIGTYAEPNNTETTVNIYNAKNLVVWGEPKIREDVWNVNFYNCSNNNYNFLMYRGKETGKAKLNLTMTNCSAEGFSDSIVHTSADGSIVIKNCTFKNNCAPINIAHKQTGSLEVSVQDSKFVNCGKVNPADDYFAPARFVNNSQTGSLNVSLKNNTFTGTVGTNGDILLGDYRTGKASHKVTAEIETTDPVMVKSSQNPAYSYAGGTIVIPVVQAGSQEELVSAIKNSEIGSVKLGSGTYTLYNVEPTKTKNTSLTVEGAGKDSTVFTAGDMTVTNANGEGSSDYSYDGSEVTFKDLTVSVGTGNYKGFVRAKSLYFENCKIVGRGSYWGVGKVVFKNCEFADNPGDYNLWTYAGTDVTFEGCTFNSSVGKFVNAYKEQRVDSKLDFINCQFNYTSSGTPEKPAVCLKSDTGIIWNVTFTNCTSNAATDSGTGSNLYSIQDGMNPGTTVKINNSVVWENGAKK